MRHFLKTIYNFSYFRPGMKAKFPVVAAVLRLSTKYEAPALRQRAIDLLATAYPSTLAAWDTRSRLRLVPPFEAEIGSLFALAIETDVRAILPGLYYAASKRSLSAMLTELHSLPLNETVRQDVISKFVVGQDKLHRAEIKHILLFLDPSYQRAGCRTATDIGRLQSQASACILKTVDVTESYQQWCNDHPNDVGASLFVCEICCTLVANTIKEGRQKIWDSLPEMFGLPAWETLLAENDLEETIGPDSGKTFDA
ncbi:unnamed protein product [Somion occarium]|uniref:Uncharacterized protein n=1 Tax=Somion occarium TaxID=3059160 RepID=A0ABP1E302_9APHY